MNKKPIVLKEKPTFDILMGVGGKFYPDPSYFMEEVLRMGINKRLPNFPEYHSPSKNKLWLVHWGTKKIFMFATGLKYRIFASEDSEACKKAKEKYGGENVVCLEYGADPTDYMERGCGHINTSGKYTRGREWK